MLHSARVDIQPAACRIVLGCVLGLSLTLVIAPTLGGCASSQSTAAADQGEPPEGYETWDDYWKAKDKDYRDFDHDMKTQRMNRPQVPGANR